MDKFAEQILKAVQGRNPLIYLQTSEEEYVSSALNAMLQTCFPGGSVSTWSCLRGLEPAVQGADTRDPAAALQRIMASPRRGFYLMKDLSAFLGDPKVVRGLREAYIAMVRDYQAALIIASPAAFSSEFLEKEMHQIELPPPSPEQLAARIREIEKKFPSVQLGGGVRPRMILALQGLPLMEVDHVLYRTFASGAAGEAMLKEIFAEKAMLTKRSGFLEFVPYRYDTDVVGGLNNVKKWALSRKNLFTQSAVDSGMSIPKGVLVMGVSGCGKSLLAKSIAGLWNVPLFRLNMSLVFSGSYGSPEAAFHRALTMVESIAPAVLWIDEMESGLSGAKESTSPHSMVFSEFLTWMQEKPPLVFVAATANRIEMLPAEIIRKGRFDEIFFVDLPDPEERYQIFKIHLERKKLDSSEVSIDRVLSATHGFTGAELEQIVIGASIEAHQAGRKVNTQDLLSQAERTVPLSKTMAEQVRLIRDWARTRAISASAREIPVSSGREEGDEEA